MFRGLAAPPKSHRPTQVVEFLGARMTALSKSKLADEEALPDRAAEQTSYNLLGV
jgi:hypothetical protein